MLLFVFYYKWNQHVKFVPDPCCDNWSFLFGRNDKDLAKTVIDTGSTGTVLTLISSDFNPLMVNWFFWEYKPGNAKRERKTKVKNNRKKKKSKIINKKKKKKK